MEPHKFVQGGQALDPTGWSMALCRTGVNATATMFPKLSDGCQTGPVRRRRQADLNEAAGAAADRPFLDASG
jgi:hypothetical protein